MRRSFLLFRFFFLLSAGGAPLVVLATEEATDVTVTTDPSQTKENEVGKDKTKAEEPLELEDAFGFGGDFFSEFFHLKGEHKNLSAKYNKTVKTSEDLNKSFKGLQVALDRAFYGAMAVLVVLIGWEARKYLSQPRKKQYSYRDL